MLNGSPTFYLSQASDSMILSCDSQIQVNVHFLNTFKLSNYDWQVTYDKGMFNFQPDLLAVVYCDITLLQAKEHLHIPLFLYGQLDDSVS